MTIVNMVGGGGKSFEGVTIEGYASQPSIGDIYLRHTNDTEDGIWTSNGIMCLDGGRPTLVNTTTAESERLLTSTQFSEMRTATANGTSILWVAINSNGQAGVYVNKKRVVLLSQKGRGEITFISDNALYSVSSSGDAIYTIDVEALSYETIDVTTSVDYIFSSVEHSVIVVSIDSTYYTATFDGSELTISSTPLDITGTISPSNVFPIRNGILMVSNSYEYIIVTASGIEKHTPVNNYYAPYGDGYWIYSSASEGYALTYMNENYSGVISPTATSSSIARASPIIDGWMVRFVARLQISDTNPGYAIVYDSGTTDITISPR